MKVVIAQSAQRSHPRQQYNRHISDKISADDQLVEVMLTDEAFQKLLFDLFCMWHDVQRHYDPPITHTEDEKMAKVKQMICKLLGEIDSRVRKIKSLNTTEEQEFIEEWTMLTWNVLCITSRRQSHILQAKSGFGGVSQPFPNGQKPPTVDVSDAIFDAFASRLAETMHILHGLYRTLKSAPQMSVEETNQFAQRLQLFADENLIPFVDMFKTFCNEQSVLLWQQVREAQITRMIDYRPMPHEPTGYTWRKTSGFSLRVDLNKVFGDYDPVQPLSDNVFSALELLMSDCVLATEPSTNPILVTNNLFSINCGALARGVVFKQFDIQVVTEEAAEHIQSEMRRQKMLQQPSPIANVHSAALLAMKPTSGTKRNNQANEVQGSSAHKKADVNSKEVVTIYPVFNSKNRYWAASYPHMLCTTRQKGRHSTNNSFQDLSPGGVVDLKSNGKRPIFYFHIRATMFSPSEIRTVRWTAASVGGNWDELGEVQNIVHSTFPCQRRRQQGLQDKDFDLLQYKIQCNDCMPNISSASSSSGKYSSNGEINTIGKMITFKNMLCPHLRYECGSTNVRFSVWRGMLELLQIFQDHKTNVKKLWEKNLIMGFLEFDQVSAILASHQSALIMRLSFGATAPMHLEPLDLKKLQAKCLKDYLRDISVAEKVKYIINSNEEPIRISDVVTEIFRDPTSGGTDDGDIDAMQQITFTAMRIAVVTCKVKPPSADIADEFLEESSADIAERIKVASPTASNGTLYNSGLGCSNNVAPYFPTNYRLPAQVSQNDDFVREVVQLCNFHGKSKQELVELLTQAPEGILLVSLCQATIMVLAIFLYPTALVEGMQPSTQQYSPPVVSPMVSNILHQQLFYENNGYASNPQTPYAASMPSSSGMISSMNSPASMLNGGSAQLSGPSNPPNPDALGFYGNTNNSNNKMEDNSFI
uniref:Uncharacterized protein n=1 Tax=Ditylenchus dipsaci TaxID=166011 RepID=A0A915E446_9BILA